MDCTTGDPNKIISIPDGGAKPLEEVKVTLLQAQNRIVNWVKADEKKGLLDAEALANLEIIAKALLDGVAYCEHVDNAIKVFVKDFGNALHGFDV